MSEHEVHDVAFKDATGIISDSDATAYFLVIEQAWSVHIDREAIRHGLWKEYSAADQVNQIKVKADRVWRSLEIIGRGAGNPALVKNVLEELPDIINYSVFAHRIMDGKV